MLSVLYWDPDRVLFVLPYINHPVTWYGFIFAFGFLVGYFFVRRMFTGLLDGLLPTLAEVKLTAIQLTDRLGFLVILGAIIGARLGHVFFYGWPYYKANPGDIIKIWEGGLASHGGAIGMFIALCIFVYWTRSAYPRLSFLTVLDVLVVPTAFVAGCIRIGNFINQEITGIPTKMPWGVVFGHPIDAPPGMAVHPVQLYESIFYFVVFLVLFFLWRGNEKKLGTGLFSGLFFLLIFSFRFLVEYLKVPQSELIDLYAPIKMGQLLSIPFIILGAVLLIRYFCFRKKSFT